MEKKKGGAGGGPPAITGGPDLSASPARSNQGAGDGDADPAAVAAKDTEIGRLNMLVKQRDNEIGILLNYLNKQKAAGGGTDVPVVGGQMINTSGAGSSTQYSDMSS